MGYTPPKSKNRIKKEWENKKTEGSNNRQTSKLAVCTALKMIRS